MCDYSLEHYRSRPANVGEKLQVHQFASRSLGMVGAPSAPAGWPGRLVQLVSKQEWDLACPVCLLPGTELAFDAPINLSVALNNDRYCMAKFVQLDRAQHVDAIELPDGKQYLLQHVLPGQTCQVLQLPNVQQLPNNKQATNNKQDDEKTQINAAYTEIARSPVFVTGDFRPASDEQAHDVERFVMDRVVSAAHSGEHIARELIARELMRNRLHHGQWDHAPALDVRWVRNPALEPLDRPVETV